MLTYDLILIWPTSKKMKSSLHVIFVGNFLYLKITKAKILSFDLKSVLDTLIYSCYFITHFWSGSILGILWLSIKYSAMALKNFRLQYWKKWKYNL